MSQFAEIVQCDVLAADPPRFCAKTQRRPPYARFRVPNQPCPACGHDTLRHLPESSKEAQVNYYGCCACRHIWTVSKQDGARITHVTRLPTKSTPPDA